MSGITIKTEITISSGDEVKITKLLKKLGQKKTAALFASKMQSSVRENWVSDFDCDVETNVRVLKVG